MSQERRQHTRIAMTVEVDLESGTNFYTGQTRDISAGGIFVETAVAIPVGEELTIKLYLLDKQYSLRTEVMWSESTAEGKSLGVGCRFVRLLPAQRKAIEAFMAKRGPLDFEVESEDDVFEVPAEPPRRTPRKK